MRDDDLHGALVGLTGFLNRPQADTLLLRRAGSALDRALFPLLIRAQRAGSLTVGELADSAGRHYSTVSRQVGTLERLGLVTREVDPQDRRHSVVRVTAAGQAEAARIGRAREQLWARLFADWTARERADLTTLLVKLVGSMESLARTERAPGPRR